MLKFLKITNLVLRDKSKTQKHNQRFFLNIISSRDIKG